MTAVDQVRRDEIKEKGNRVHRLQWKAPESPNSELKMNHGYILKVNR